MASISFGAPQTDVGERDGAVTIPLLRTGDLDGTVVATYQTSDDTAAAGIAYAATDGSVTFGPGETSKLVSIPILDEGSSQGSESFGVQLQSVAGGDIGFPRTTRVVIHDGQALSGAAAPDVPGPAVTAETAVVSGLSSPTAFDWVPGQPATMVIAEKSGLIKVARNGVVLDAPLLDPRSVVNDSADRGLIDVKLNPRFATEPYLYAYYTVDPPDTAGNPAGSDAGPDGAGDRYEQRRPRGRNHRPLAGRRGAGGRQRDGHDGGRRAGRAGAAVAGGRLRGNAQYAVSVDGVQIGGVLTATATRASGQFDTLTVLGDFGPGLHQAAVSFLNDAWGGTPDTDRNLFLGSASYNGAPVASATQGLLQAGPAYFTFGDAAPTAP